MCVNICMCTHIRSRVFTSSNVGPKSKQSGNGPCIAPSRPTFYRNRTVSQRKRENSRNRWWGPECKLSYLSHMLCIDKQWPGAIQSALSLAERAKDPRRRGNRRQQFSQLALIFRGGRTVCEGLSARLADDLLSLGEPGDHHQQ
jgi:hypothetical protein